jgi:hypothetical protein
MESVLAYRLKLKTQQEKGGTEGSSLYVQQNPNMVEASVAFRTSQRGAKNAVRKESQKTGGMTETYERSQVHCPVHPL